MQIFKEHLNDMDCIIIQQVLQSRKTGELLQELNREDRERHSKKDEGERVNLKPLLPLAERCSGRSKSEIPPGPPPYDNEHEPTGEEEVATSSRGSVLFRIFLCSFVSFVNLNVICSV